MKIKKLAWMISSNSLVVHDAWYCAKLPLGFVAEVIHVGLGDKWLWRITAETSGVCHEGRGSLGAVMRECEREWERLARRFVSEAFEGEDSDEDQED